MAKIHSLEEIIVKSSSTVSDSAIKASKVCCIQCVCGDFTKHLGFREMWFIDCHVTCSSVAVY